MSKLIRRANSLDLGSNDVVRNAKLGVASMVAGAVPLLAWHLLTFVVAFIARPTDIEAYSDFGFVLLIFYLLLHGLSLLLIGFGALALSGSGALALFWSWHRG